MKTDNRREETKTVDLEVVKSGRKGAKSQEIDPVSWFVSRMMDSFLRVPGTRFRFGVNPLIGAVPIVGDWIDAGISSTVLFRSLKHRLPRIILARMALNVMINAILQGIPVVGDAATFFFRANMRNYRLLQQHAGKGKEASRGDWIFVFGVIGVTLAIAVSLTAFLFYVIKENFHLW